MATSTPVLIPVEEYLNTSYHPDCDYVDGQILERNMGEKPHSRLQGFFAAFFRSREDEWNIEVLTEQRLQINPTRYRIPDVMVTSLEGPDELIVRTPPILCVEIFSSKDRPRKTQERADDYARIGVQATWAIDPWRHRAYAAAADGVLHEEPGALRVAGTPISITVAAVFDELIRLEKRFANQAKK